MKISMQSYAALLGQYLSPHRSRVFLLAGCLVGATALQLAGPQVMRSIIDTSMAEGMTTGLIWMVVLFVALALVEQGAATAATYFGEDLVWKTTNVMRSDLTRHCLGLDLSFHAGRTPGELIERIDGDVSALSNFFSNFAIQLMGNALFIVGVLAVLFSQDWRAGATVLVYVAVTFFLLDRVRNVAVPYWAASREATAELYGFLEERITGAQAIRTSSATGFVLNRFYDLTRKAWRQTLKAALMATAVVNISWLLFAIGNAAMLVVTALLYMEGTLSLGSAYLLVHYVMLLGRPIDAITRQMEDVQRAGASISRIQELFSIQTRVPDGPGIALPDGALGVEFQQVRFGYSEAQAVLQDLSFTLMPGTVLGLLGRTGSGKSTLTRLIARLYHPTGGTVRLGGAGAPGADLRQARQADLADRIAIVTQRVQLFHASLRDNLTLFDSRVPDERIIMALEELGLGAWYRSLPAGLGTVLAPGGGGLSAGEAQLLAFTRVFLKDPGIIILDEPTSRLDPATEQVVQRAVERLLKGRTAIVIAHRLATVEKVDEIMILENGRVQEHGARETLAADPRSQFAKLLQTGLEEMIA